MGKIAINIFYIKEIKELNAKLMFLFPQVCKVPKEGHFYAQVKALLCPREAQWCTSKTPPVNPKHRFLSFGDTSGKQVILQFLSVVVR